MFLNVVVCCCMLLYVVARCCMLLHFVLCCCMLLYVVAWGYHKKAAFNNVGCGVVYVAVKWFCDVLKKIHKTTPEKEPKNEKEEMRS